jgi:hypothetical protein
MFEICEKESGGYVKYLRLSFLCFGWSICDGYSLL